jgi:hypothetical protein
MLLCHRGCGNAFEKGTFRLAVRITYHLLQENRGIVFVYVLFRKKAKLEEERLAREAEIREFQRAHYREMREAAERNRRQIMSDIGADKKVAGAAPGCANGQQRQQSPPPHNGRSALPQQNGMTDMLTEVTILESCF